MYNLLKANFSRMFKDRLTLVVLIFTVIYCFNSAYNIICSLKSDIISKNDIGSILFDDTLILIFIVAIITSLFISADYDNGTIKNKLIIGIKRHNIYLSNLFVSYAVSFCVIFLYLAIKLFWLSCTKNMIDIGLKNLFVLFLVLLLGTLAFSSSFTLISMICKNKALALILTLGLTVILTQSYLGISAWLNEPKFIEVYLDNQLDSPIARENVSYLSNDFLRSLFEMFLKINPATYFYRLINLSDGLLFDTSTLSFNAKNLYSILYCLAANLVGINLIGLYSFSKKDIK